MLIVIDVLLYLRLLCFNYVKLLTAYVIIMNVMYVIPMLFPA